MFACTDCAFTSAACVSGFNQEITMSRIVTVLASIAFVFLGTSPFAVADDFWSRNELSQSSWNSVYTTANGGRVQAQIKLNGGQGVYLTSFGEGRLSNIQYGVDTTSMPGRPFFQITGRWSFQGQSGQFLFASNGRDKFSGSWQGNGGGKWNGTAMYGMWKNDPNKDRMFCEYRYPAKDNPAQINVQIMIWYPNDPDRTGYYYFANKENKIWGRCVCPKNSNYDPNVMQWSKLMGDNWQELPAGDCPAPKDGDPSLAAIDKIPDPPA